MREEEIKDLDQVISTLNKLIISLSQEYDEVPEDQYKKMFQEQIIKLGVATREIEEVRRQLLIIYVHYKHFQQ